MTQTAAFGLHVILDCNQAWREQVLYCGITADLWLQARPMPGNETPFLPEFSGSKLTEAKSPAFSMRSRGR